MLRSFASQGRPRQLWLAACLVGAGGLLLGVVVVLKNLRQQGSLVLPLAPAHPTPSPPSQARWQSPLVPVCAAATDRALTARLQALQRTLPSRIETLGIDPSNYGERLRRDAYGNPLDVRPALVVLHETVYGLGSAINTFTTHHPDDADQVSYHVLIGEGGRVVQALDPSKRAFGAGYSAFQGRWAVTNPAMAGSVNNFALHVSLETPLDGENSAASHSGYSTAQYDALAVVLADWMRRYGIAHDHITTHRHVDLGLERADPRSFSWNALQRRLVALRAYC